MRKSEKYLLGVTTIMGIVLGLVIPATTQLARSEQIRQDPSITKIADISGTSSVLTKGEDENPLLNSTDYRMEGRVLPPKAKPKGYSLEDLAKLIAPFQDSFDTSLLPKTPFQILFIPTITSTSNSFTVPAGTYFYVPVASVSDSPPVLGTFPSNPKEAAFYFFDPSQIGTHNFRIIVDGKPTPISPKYLTGPVTELLPGGGTQTVVFAAFLSPLSVGTHTVEIQGEFDGTLVIDSLGMPSVENLTYTIEVVPH